MTGVQTCALPISDFGRGEDTGFYKFHKHFTSIGGFYREQWFASPWPHGFAAPGASSALHEIYPVVVACHLWGQSWRRKRIAVKCDNQAVVSIINKGRSHCPLIMTFMTRITWLSVCHNFILTARAGP